MEDYKQSYEIHQGKCEKKGTEFDNSDKFTCLFTGSAAYSLLANNMGWGYDVSKINIPYFMTAGTGTSDDAGNSNVHRND